MIKANNQESKILWNKLTESLLLWDSMSPNPIIPQGDNDDFTTTTCTNSDYRNDIAE